MRPNWLVELGAPMIEYSDPLESPAPRYNADLDRVRCFVTPFFGPNKWALPHTEIDFPVAMDKYKYFAQAILDGTAVPQVRTLIIYQFMSSYQCLLVATVSGIPGAQAVALDQNVVNE